jgi:hypothetical protein
MSQYDELKRLLDSTSGERDVVKWLKHNRENTLVLSRAVSTFGFPNLVVAEFQLGTDHKADFVLLGRYSGGFSVHFVEVEPPDIPLYNKKGVPSARLAEAIKQIEDWKSFATTKRAAVIDELEKTFKKRELIWGRSKSCSREYGQTPSRPRRLAAILLSHCNRTTTCAFL